MRAAIVLRAVAVAAAVALAWPAAAQVPDPASPSDPASLPDDAWGGVVRQGRALMTRTFALIGPEVADAADIYAGNNLACSNCHLDAGAARYGLRLQGVFAAYPAFNPRSDAVITLQDRVNQCMTRSMNGRALPADGPLMLAIVSYLKFLSDGVPVGHAPARPAALPAPPSVPDAANGAGVYARTCAACHGPNGQGVRVGKVGDAKGYQFPPLWGPDSFNRQAGMDRIMIASRFIHGNMPAGTTPDQPVLSLQDAWDVAAFVDAQDRP